MQGSGQRPLGAEFHRLRRCLPGGEGELAARAWVMGEGLSLLAVIVAVLEAQAPREPERGPQAGQACWRLQAS